MGNKFDAGEIVTFVKSGKDYYVTGHNGRDDSRVGVIGWKNGTTFGPIRFLDVDKLVRKEAQ